jgi:hypothetical protein
MTIKGTVPDSACLVIGLILGEQQLASQTRAKILYISGRKRDGLPRGAHGNKAVRDRTGARSVCPQPRCRQDGCRSGRGAQKVPPVHRRGAIPVAKWFECEHCDFPPVGNERSCNRVIFAIVRAFPQARYFGEKETDMGENVYKVIELIGTSNVSWEKAAAAAVARAGKTIRDLRVAEIVELDMQLKKGKVEAYRAKVKVSFKYERDK